MMRWRETAAWLREASGLAHSRRVALGRHDPWLRFDVEPPLRAFGPGAEDFRGYLTRSSRVACPTALAVAEWLQNCHYAEDIHLHDEHDHWVHPVTFELVRTGDCEDFSLWGWRKLVEADYDVEFVVGMRRLPGAAVGRHAWLVYRDGEGEYLLDGVERGLSRALRALDEVKAYYDPQVGVGRDARAFAFGGLYREPWGRALRLRSR